MVDHADHAGLFDKKTGSDSIVTQSPWPENRAPATWSQADIRATAVLVEIAGNQPPTVRALVEG